MQKSKAIGLAVSRLPKMVGELTHSIQFLKLFSLSALAVSVLLTLTLSFLVGRPPLVLTLAPNATPLERVGAPKVEDQIRAAITRYTGIRYGWEPETVVSRLKDAQAFILPKNLRVFQGALSEVSRFSVDRQVSQRVYPVDIKVDLESKTALVVGDRVTSIQGLKAAGDLKVTLSFDAGPHTKENPWGIYFTKEREE